MSTQQIYTSIGLYEVAFWFSYTFPKINQHKDDDSITRVKFARADLLGLDLYNKINLRPKENGFVCCINSFVSVSQSIDWAGASLS